MARKSRHKRPLVNFLLILRLFFRNFLVAFFIIAGVILLILDRFGHPLPEAIRVTTLDTVAPLMELSVAPVNFYHDTIDGLSSWFYTGSENKKLRETIRELEHLQYIASNLELENQGLREALRMSKDVKTSFITAPIIGSIHNVYDHTLFVPVDGREEIKIGAIVISHQAIVGRIVAVGKQLARIQLLTDIDTRVPIITSDSQTRAVIAGTNRDSLTLKHAPTDHKITLGERVLSSGDGGTFPPGILVGEVVEIDDKLIRIKPYIDPSKIDYVHILDL